MTLAITDPGGMHEYSDDVKYEIRQGTKGDYARAAEFVNYSGVKLVSIQHEYGIFGGDDGAYVLDFVSALRVPSMVTLHTALKHPSESQRSIVRKLAKQCAGLVVMSRVAAGLLETSYGIRNERIHVIEHGIPDIEPRDRETLKARFSVSGRRVLLTFGLLSPNKGIETVIRGLPAVLAAFPNTVYFVVGATHPMVRRDHGEAYRNTLEREAEQLGVRDHVVFRDQFVAHEELLAYLQAADIFVSPYLNEAQVTSGALSYAMGAGAAVVSTPYWHAQELLAEGRGRLFPFGDSDTLGQTLIDLFRSPSEMDRIRAAAFELTRTMTWPRIGKRYLALGLELIEKASVPARSPPSRPSSLPDLRLDHLQRLTDDTGIIQHATYSVPSRASGYCVDDNARALMVALQADRLNSSPETHRLVTLYLSYLQASQDETGGFRNFLSYSRVFGPDDPSEDCLGRAIWALGTTVQLAADEGCRRLAREMMQRAISRSGELGPRGMALVLLGLVNFLAVDPATEPRALLGTLADKLVRRYQEHATSDWHWFESDLTYDNAMLPLALFKAFAVTGERTSLRVARESLEFLEEVCFRSDRLFLVGNQAWHSRGGVKSDTDEQAIDAAAFVLAFRGAYQVTQDHHYLRRMRQAFAWFMGANRLGEPLYDFRTGGCRDGLGEKSPNENQGAESTLSFLTSLLSMTELVGEGLEYETLAGQVES